MPHSAYARVVAAVATLALSATCVSAQSPADFYKGKSITLLMGTGPGASYDMYGRTIAEHLAKHMGFPRARFHRWELLLGFKTYS